jgi:hypothetical protein
MAKGEALAELEHLVLLAVRRLGDDAYGMRVRREIVERMVRYVTIGAVYATSFAACECGRDPYGDGNRRPAGTGVAVAGRGGAAEAVGQLAGGSPRAAAGA